MQEKKFFKILNEVTEWLFRFIVINLLVISTSLLIFTIVPAITAAYKLFIDYLNKDEENIFKGYFRYFKEEFSNKTIIGVLYLILLFLIVLSVMFYYEGIKNGSNNVLNYIALGIIIIFGIIILVSFILLPLTFLVTDINRIDYIIKLSLRLAFTYIVRTIFLVIVFILPFFLLLNSLTTLLLLFMGVSLPIALNAAITMKPYEDLIKIGGDNDES